MLMEYRFHLRFEEQVWGMELAYVRQDQWQWQLTDFWQRIFCAIILKEQKSKKFTNLGTML